MIYVLWWYHEYFERGWKIVLYIFSVRNKWNFMRKEGEGVVWRKAARKCDTVKY